MHRKKKFFRSIWDITFCKNVYFFFDILERCHKSFSNSRFFFIMCQIHFYIIILSPRFRWYIVKFTFLSAHSLFGLRLDFSKKVWKALAIVILFLSFKETTHVYLVMFQSSHKTSQMWVTCMISNVIIIKNACYFS